MKSIVVFTCCLVLGLGVVTAEQAKEGKGKKGGGQGRHAQQGHPQGGGGGGNKGKLHRQGGGNNAAQMNAGHNGGKGHKGQRNLSAGGQANVPAVQKGRVGGGKAQVKHFDFANSRNTRIESVKFHENRRIVGAEHWKGNNYVVFRNYHSAWHDHGWWVAHHSRIVLIGGGWYYWNSGFWYPAWGYEPAQVYYPYDGPIYAYNDLPPDQVVANVQGELQNQGYYHGDVDGLLGPLTRAALADYQKDHDLYTTSAIDQPTMSSLGFS